MATETESPILKAPFPAFGGKSQVVNLVWERLGNPRNYAEPFAFSAVMMLRRPHVGAIETINDLNAYVSNFWRAIKADPEAVAAAADWPVNETDLHARHRWLVQSEDARNRLQKVRDDPEYFDAKIAGWWCWGACCWIGSGWCDTKESPEWSQMPITSTSQGVSNIADGKMPLIGDRSALGRGVIAGGVERDVPENLPALSGDGSSGRGVHAPSGGASNHEKRPCISADGGEFGRGIHGEAKIWEGRGSALQSPRRLHAMSGNDHRPQLADAFSRGRGVNGNDAAGTCQRRREWLLDWCHRLADRLRPVRVCCGHWSRICDSDSTLIRLGTTGVFLDPPYRKHIDGAVNRAAHIYANDRTQDVGALCDEVQAWCLKWGDDPEIRIALCGLEGEYPMLTPELGWEVVAWKSRGGYGNRTERGKENAARERIWFNRACLRPVPPAQGSMF